MLCARTQKIYYFSKLRRGGKCPLPPLPNDVPASGRKWANIVRDTYYDTKALIHKVLSTENTET